MKKKLIIFDLDGVLINSISNMRYAWKNTCTEHNLKIPFKFYRNLIGLPFDKILKNLKIKKKLHLSISRSYNFYSKKKIQQVKINKKKINFLNKLLKNKYKLALYTSKNPSRTNLILGKERRLFKTILCPNNKLRGKPYPDGLNFLVKKFNVTKNETLFLGDSLYDYYAAKRSNVDYIHAGWGYHNIKINNKLIIKRIENIQNYLK